MKHEKISAGTPLEPFTEIVKLLERAARNGTRAHLDPEHVQALLSQEIFLVLAECMRKEISGKWERQERAADSSASTGSGIVRTATIGASAGSKARTTRRISLRIGGGTPDAPPEEAELALANHFAANEQSLQHEAQPTEVLVEDITRQWLTQHVADLNDPDRYLHSVLTLEKFYEHQRRRGKMPDPYTVASVRSAFVRDFVEFRKSQGASLPTISRDLAALRGPIHWALEENILASAPRIKDVKGRNKSRSLVYTPQQVAALLDAAVAYEDRHHVALYIVIAMSSHGRSQAILELNADTQLSDGCIHFNAPDREQTPKKRATVPIAPTLAPWLEGITGSVIKYVSLPNKDGRRFIREGLSDIGRAFEACLITAGATKNGEGMRRPELDAKGNQLLLPPRMKLGETETRQAWKGVGTPNTLRHSLHTYLSAKGVPPAQINTAAGHDTVLGTGKKYDHLVPGYLREFIAGVEEFWREVDEFTDAHRRPIGPLRGIDSKH